MHKKRSMSHLCLETTKRVLLLLLESRDFCHTPFSSDNVVNYPPPRKQKQANTFHPSPSTTAVKKPTPKPPSFSTRQSQTDSFRATPFSQPTCQMVTSSFASSRRKTNSWQHHTLSTESEVVSPPFRGKLASLYSSIFTKHNLSQ